MRGTHGSGGDIGLRLRCRMHARPMFKRIDDWEERYASVREAIRYGSPGVGSDKAHDDSVLLQRTELLNEDLCETKGMG